MTKFLKSVHEAAGGADVKARNENQHHSREEVEGLVPCSRRFNIKLFVDGCSACMLKEMQNDCDSSGMEHGCQNFRSVGIGKWWDPKNGPGQWNPAAFKNLHSSKLSMGPIGKLAGCNKGSSKVCLNMRITIFPPDSLQQSVHVGKWVCMACNSVLECIDETDENAPTAIHFLL